MAVNWVDMASWAVPAAASAWSAAQTNKANENMSREQMNFQERMSSTAHTREVEDLRRAGLNPMLSVNAGASSPAGAQSTMQPAVGAGVASAQDARRMAMERRMQAKQMEGIDAEVALKGTQAALNVAALPAKKSIGDAVTSGLNALSWFRFPSAWREGLEPLPSKGFVDARNAQINRGRILRGGVRRAASSAPPRFRENFPQDSSGVFRIPFERRK